MPPMLGLSIQLARFESLFRPLQATKSARHLADELHILFVQYWMWRRGSIHQARCPRTRLEILKLIRGEIIHVLHHR
jgi:hypothetical protein